MLGKRSLSKSLADVQLRDNGTITLDIFLGQVVEQAAALTNHLVHAKTAVVIVGVTLQVLGELKDALGKNGDLDFGRTGVVLVGGVLAATRQRAERLPQRRHDPVAGYADDASYITIRPGNCQEKCFESVMNRYSGFPQSRRGCRQAWAAGGTRICTWWEETVIMFKKRT